MDGSEVSIVVVTWDAVELLPGALASLRSQEWRGHRPHLVVVDNASTDGTREWLAAHATDLAPLALDIEHFSNHRQHIWPIGRL